MSLAFVRPRQLAGAALVAAATGMLAPASADAQAYSQPVVQAVPDPASQQLNEALRALARDPRLLSGLLSAAEASLALDDVDAAEGFVRRAEAVAPGDGQVLAARASILVRQRQPVEALQMFAQAEQLGGLSLSHISERGLALDLIGDNVHAQEAYAVALAAGPDPRVSRRLALSQAIAGDGNASEATLLPMLQRTDLAAYRTRAFALAILGRTEEAVSIAETMLPERLSSRMAPYLRYMPRLTRAQQAAAGNLGVFPQAAQIGRDDPALAAYAPQSAPARPATQTADARLVPAGQPLGGVRRREQPTVPAPVPTPTPAPPPAVAVQATPPAPVQVALAAPQSQPLPAEDYGPPPTVASTLPAVEDVPAPSISIAEATPAPAPASVRDAFADFSLARGAGIPAAAPAGAVDITQIQPRREAPPAPARPIPPPNPSRQWVQVATGRDIPALAFDWRRIKREAGGVLDRSSAFTAKWGQTNRLVIGPFTTTREADAMVNRLKDKKIDSFRFTSDAGQEVKPLS